MQAKRSTNRQRLLSFQVICLLLLIAAIQLATSNSYANAQNSNPQVIRPATDGSPTAGNTTPNPTNGNTTTTPNPTSGNTTTTPNPTNGNTTTTPNPTNGNTTTTPNPTNGNTTTTPNPTSGNMTTTPNPTNGNITTTPNPTSGNMTTTPNPSTSPSVSVSPNPSTSPNVSPNPSTSPSVSVSPNPNTSPNPSASPSTSPNVSPNPSASPSTSPNPTTSPSVSPNPTTTPNPSATPNPGATPNPNEPSVSILADQSVVSNGRTVNFMITVNNPLDVNMTQVMVQDNVPTSLTVQNVTSSQGVARVNGQQVTVDLGTIPPGGQASITINAVATGPNGTVTNEVSVQGNTGSGASSGTQTTATSQVTITGGLPNAGRPEAEMLSWPVLVALSILGGQPLATSSEWIWDEFERVQSVRSEATDMQMFGKTISTQVKEFLLPLSRLHPANSPIVPSRIRIPALGVDANIESISFNKNGAMDVPSNIHHAGWLRDGVRPGDDGTALLTGHLDSLRGLAIFRDLKNLKEGDLIYVSNSKGSELTFRITQKASYLAANAPLDKIYGYNQNVKGLNLITCDGNFIASQRSYDQRLVVYTELVNSK